MMTQSSGRDSEMNRTRQTCVCVVWELNEHLHNNDDDM